MGSDSVEAAGFLAAATATTTATAAAIPTTAASSSSSIGPGLASSAPPNVPYGGGVPASQFRVVRPNEAMRYFSPREMLSLHGFPRNFAFPPDLGDRACWRLIGNSLNVVVVAELLHFLEHVSGADGCMYGAVCGAAGCAEAAAGGAGGAGGVGEGAMKVQVCDGLLC